MVELQVANMGMSSVVKGEDRKMELWISGQSDIYRSAIVSCIIYMHAGEYKMSIDITLGEW